MSSTKTNVGESTIRLMTRLAKEHSAINLSQGIPSESPPFELRLRLAWGVLNGSPLESTLSEQECIKELIKLMKNGPTGRADEINQYSPPMGRTDLRSAISKYYKRFYEYDVSPGLTTVTLGATEAIASALRTIGRPADKCVIIEPFHELYPNQCKIFFLEPIFVSLQASNNGEWILDANELEEALKDAKMLLLNSPHNPTGKVFHREELKTIVDLCLKYDVYIITDEIYEHMCFDGSLHYVIPKEFPEIAHRTLVCNSLGKSASATGWRLGWCLHPPHLTDTYRGIHDQMTVMSPHPVQYASLQYFTLPDVFFQDLCRKYKEKVRKLEGVLASVGFGVVSPQGAYYLFVDYTGVEKLHGKSCLDAAMYLMKVCGVAAVPGDNFYGTLASQQAARHLRFAACRSEKDLDEASRRILEHFG